MVLRHHSRNARHSDRNTQMSHRATRHTQDTEGKHQVHALQAQQKQAARLTEPTPETRLPLQPEAQAAIESISDEGQSKPHEDETRKRT